MPKAFVIAEAGSCHDGELEKAYRLIGAAQEAGADACKFQYWSSAAKLAARRNAKRYFDIYEKYQMPTGWLEKLYIYCNNVGIEFMCTAYLEEDIEVVNPFVKRFKIASFESADAGFIKSHAKFKKQVIISSGMCTGKDVHTLFRVSRRELEDVKILHCVSSYPTPVEEVNLGAVSDPIFHGFSDHTTSLLTGAFAVCACWGETIIEKHFMLHDTVDGNPDYPHSIVPIEFMKYVQNIRLAELVLGDGFKRIMPCEASMVKHKVGQ